MSVTMTPSPDVDSIATAAERILRDTMAMESPTDDDLEKAKRALVSY